MTIVGVTSSKTANAPRRAGMAYVCLLACCFAAGAGCGKAKSAITGPKPAPGYLALTSPENALVTMIRAYANRDTTELGLVYDDAYQGTSLDTDDLYPVILNFNKRDEIQHVATLAHIPSITSVSVSLNPVIRRYSDSADPAGWASLQNPIRAVEVNDGATSHSVYLSYETLTYKVIPTTPDGTSPTDTTWKIIRWSEVAF